MLDGYGVRPCGGWQMGDLLLVPVKSMRVMGRTRAGGKAMVVGGLVPLGHVWGGVRACTSPVHRTCLSPHRGDDGRRVCSSQVRIWSLLLNPPTLSVDMEESQRMRDGLPKHTDKGL